MDGSDAANYVQDLVGENANIIFGAKFDESMVDEAIVTVIATGLGDAAPAPKVMPSMKYTQAPTSRMANTTRTSGNLGSVTRPASPYGTVNQPSSAASSGNLGVTASTLGIQRPRRPESTVPERDIKIPEFLKNTRK